MNHQKKTQFEDDDEITSTSIDAVISKFTKKGFIGLTTEDLAITILATNFADKFKKETGIDWATNWEKKALDKIRNSNVDFPWLNAKENPLYNQVFEACKTGDFEKIQQFFLKPNPNFLFIFDKTKKTLLHIASKNGHMEIVTFLLSKG